MKNRSSLLMRSAAALGMLLSALQPATVFAESSFQFRYSISGATADTATPDAFYFPSLLNQEPAKQVVGGPVSISGLAKSVTATSVGGELSTDGGATWDSSVSVSSGTSLLVRATTSPVFQASKQITIKAGSFATSWKVTTMAMPSPDGFSFQNLPDLAPGSSHSSNTITLSGFPSQIPITVSADSSARAAVSINGGAGVVSGSVKAGDTIQLSATARPSESSSQVITVSIGGAVKTWTLATQGIQKPDAFTFDNRANLEPGSVQVSNAVTLSGFTGGLEASVVGDTSAKISVNDGPLVTSATVHSGNKIKVSAAASDSVSTSRNITVSVGPVSSTWTLTTWGVQTPAQFAFTDLDNQEPGSSVTSNPVTLSGFSGELTATVSGGSNSALKINNQSWASSGTVKSGDTVTLKTSASNSASTSASVTLSIASTLANWSVRTWPVQKAADFSFSKLASVEPGSQQTSEQVTLSGFMGKMDVSLSANADAQAMFSVSGQPWSSSGKVQSGDTLQLIAKAAAGTDTDQAVTVSMGGTSSTWTIHTWPTQHASAFAYADSIAATPGALTASNYAAMSGFQGSLPVSVAGATGAQYRIKRAGGTVTDWTSGADTVKSGDSIQLQAPATSDSVSSLHVILTVGDTSGTWKLHPAAKFVFATVTTGTSWTVPNEAKSITVKSWGGGGGWGNASGTPVTNAGRGGGGGFAQSTLQPAAGSTLTVVVGKAGNAGGAANVVSGGGGHSGIFNGATPLLIAGGAGGGGGAMLYSGAIVYGGIGGAGGGSTGGAGGNSSGKMIRGGGYGGSQSTGGIRTTETCTINGPCGAYLIGGVDTTYGGGGGSGYYGGAAGNGLYGGGGGGGGSNFITGTSTVSLQGSGTAAANSSDADYAGSVGSGGAAASQPGQPGRVVIIVNY